MLGRVLRGHTKGVRTMAWSPDGKLLASASEDNTIRLWDRDGHIVKLLEGHNSVVYFLAWAPDGELLASVEPGSGAGDKDPAIIGLWDQNGAHVTWQKTLPIRAIAWSPDGKVLASGCQDRMIRLWDRDGKLNRVLEGHRGGVYSLAWAPTSGLLASSSGAGEILLWDKEWNFTKIYQDEDREIQKLKWSPDGELLASFGSGRILIWNEEGKRVKDLIIGRGTSVAHTEDIIDLTWAPNSFLLASASWDRTIRIWERDGKYWKIFQVSDPRTGLYLVPMSIAWWTDSYLLASTYNDATLRIWNMEGDCIGTAKLFLPKKTGRAERIKILSRAEDKTDYEDRVAWSPDGKLLTIWERDRSSIQLLEWINSRKDTIPARTSENMQPEETGLTEQERKCPICFQDFETNKIINRCYHCGTIFHTSCIMRWFLGENHKICPFCKNLCILHVDQE